MAFDCVLLHGGEKGKLALSVLLSVVSIVAGILPYFCPVPRH